MRKKLLTILILNSLCVIAYGQNWVNVSLNNRVSVDFPSKPQVQDEFSNVTFYHLDDSAYVINVRVSDIDISYNSDSLQSLYHQAIKAKLKTEWNGKMVGERKVKLDSYDGWEADYTALWLTAVREVPVTTRMIIIDRVLFVFDFIHLQPGQERLNETFFKSIKVK